MFDRKKSVGKVPLFGFYFLMLLVAGVIFAFIRFQGERVHPHLASGQGALIVPHDQINALLHVLLALAVVIITARGMGALFKYLHQPAVIGEVLGEFCSPPSLLGRFAPSLYAYLLPAEAASPSWESSPSWELSSTCSWSGWNLT